MAIITANSDKTGKRYNIPALPFTYEIETKAVLKKAGEARSALAELKGFAETIPNENILISTLSLQEAQDSSAVENIITTHDELYKSDTQLNFFTTPSAKEVHKYAQALRNGYKTVKESSTITNRDIKKIQETLEGNNAGFRSQAGTSLKNEQTQEIIYTPPQNLAEIESHMKNLEDFINDDSICNWDNLVKMAVIHHQFESIHPFFDGNGRTGRIIIILYLIQKGLLNTPVLYFSRYINQNKAQYYKLLQDVRDRTDKEKAWEEWILYVLEGIRHTSIQTTKLIKSIKDSMQSNKHKIRSEMNNIYTQDLINILFSHPYTKISNLEEGLGISRPTAAKYLDKLNEAGILIKLKIGRESFYINHNLMDILSNVRNM